MKKIVLMVAVVACVAFASQKSQAVEMNPTVENVLQDDFKKIEVKDLPQPVAEAIAKSYADSSVKEAFASGEEGAKKYKVVLLDKDQKEQTVLFDEKGVIVK